MKNKLNNIDFEVKNLLSEFFKIREEEIYDFTDSERELLSKRAEDYSKLYTSLENIPDAFVERSR